MHSTTESPRISRRLSTVQELLEQLGSMKAEGLGARERLDFLQQHGPELVEEFSYEDAFDAEARASSTRREHLHELGGTVQDMTNAWRASPLSQAVRDAGVKLAAHLSAFVEDAERQERHAETEMLAQVWEHAPDVRWLYPWMTAWDGPVYIPRPAGEFRVRYGVQGDALEEVEEPAEGETQLRDAKAELETELSDGEDEELQKLYAEKLEGDFKAREKEVVAKHEEIVKELTPADVTKADLERRTRDIDQGKLEPRKYEVTREEVAVARVSHHEDAGRGGTLDENGRFKPLATREETSSTQAPQPDELRRMRQDAWTQAIRDVTLERWDFHIEADGHVGGRGHGTAMIWELEGDRTSFARLEITEGGEGLRHVRLAASTQKLGTRALEREMTQAKVDELHLDPSSFVKDALGPS